MDVFSSNEMGTVEPPLVGAISENIEVNCQLPLLNMKTLGSFQSKKYIYQYHGKFTKDHVIAHIYRLTYCIREWNLLM